MLGWLARIARLLLHRGSIRSPGAQWGPRWLALLTARTLARTSAAVGVHYDAQVSESFDPAQQYMVVWHPHGAFTYSALCYGGLLSLLRQPVRWYTGVASILFKVPLLRQILLLLNARRCDASVLRALLAEGHSVGLQPGGIAEQLRTTHMQEQAFFPPNLSFLRLALEHGTPLLPVYIFGENQLFRTTPTLQRFARRIFALSGIPAVVPLGRWGLPWLIPRPTNVLIAFGQPVYAGPPQEPTDAAVEEVFTRYSAELNRLFEEHKDARLPSEIAARGLTIVRRTRPVQPPKAKGKNQEAIAVISRL
ncbi:diacylglycerol acyltransferase-domain-containing protein [Pavlovales sp. CCMP2436]|nr:diacylglycerol acyltransferase-domain-containing protein [Pavlovales sp. CCMP2436]